MKFSNRIANINMSHTVEQNETNQPGTTDPEIENQKDYKFLIACTLIKDAVNDRLAIPYKRDERSIKLYEMYYQKLSQYTYYILLYVNLLLIFFEDPASFENFKLPNYIPELINFICLVYFFIHWFHILSFTNPRELYTERYNIITPIVLTLMVIDLGIGVIMKIVSPQTPHLQWSRFLRPCLAALFPENFSIRAALGNIKCTLVDILPTFCLFIFMLTFFSIVCFEIFVNSDIINFNGTPYLQSFFNCFFELYVLVTTSNSPDVVLPAYEKHGAYFLIYILVTVLCNWMFMGIVVANVYNTYKDHLKEHVIEMTKRKKNKLAEAFSLMKNENNRLSFDDFVRLMKAVYPKMTDDHCSLIFHLIDYDDIKLLKISEFIRLSEYADLQFDEIHIKYETVKRKLPVMYNCYMSNVNRIFIRIIRHKYWKYLCEGIVVLNIICMVILNNDNEFTLEIIFTCFFVFELILRCFSTGFNLFFKDIWNIFDAIVVGLALMGLIINYILVLFDRNLPKATLRLLLIGRVLRILKLLTVVKRFKQVIHCLVLIIPSLFAYALVQLSFYYVYVCLGMKLFGGKYQQPKNNSYTNTTDCGNPKLLHSDFVSLHYCILNFNNALNGFILMLILTVSNNWHILLTGSTLTTNEGAKIFYISIHWTCVLLVMNIVLAFIIDAYMIEMEVNNTKFQDFIENRLVELNVSAHEELNKRGLDAYGTDYFDLTREMLKKAFEGDENQDKVCFRFADKGPRSMEGLLKRMFEADVDHLHENFVLCSLSGEIRQMFESIVQVPASNPEQMANVPVQPAQANAA